MDEVAIYRRMMPAEEVSRHYWSIVPRTNSTANLVRHRLDLIAERSTLMP
jgi:hypothetical protein